ncbi:MAG TPA: subtilase family protease [Cyanobacteria bacterium UBA11149]|nr:subtilase family protease [Cyanobacteria bacterium UBA11367]HBE60639.1 subtilase family protease [Cyanobacteria bacterium UBA11366]HBK63988.1 subtilase family protease [Cyanobacteria bacterium UBA11166]HBR73911.1 subtilase family protease [Cyanobacteria bacterium UBA11159]HBS72469.1 subtilase family protease [Cyanobacteria bacterium UBA11153]HBW91862.1 subtilase family protease [Cyanobacteria bacterium UBA11149]HCA96860.1 subtilase family protease [Cyanobacteria bacterium UBA9226]
MVKSSDQFPHIQLKLKTQGTAASPPPASRKQHPQTAKNLSDRWGHGRKLRSSIHSLVSYWQDIQEQRDQEDKPPLPEKAKPIVLQIDPTAFDAEDLRKYGIEVIAELENGYIIGASANDPELSELQTKLNKFIQQERGGNKIAEIWDILDGSKRPEYILSPELLNQWDKIMDEQIYTVDVGIACIGTKSQLPNCPKRNDGESDDKYTKRINTWINKRDITYQEWDSLKSTREDELTDFVNSYQGDVINIVDGSIPRSAELSDSFSCRIQISGKGLKDLVLNFPYIFDVSEPDEFAEIIQRQGLSDREEPSFTLEPPEPNAPKVCVIDSGIQERHSLLKAAIDAENSRSWVPGEKDRTADYVSDGGHGTRVAGAVLYPSTIPRQGTQQAVCWIQNARILDANCQLSEQLFPPNILGDIVEFYHGKTGTKIFNHSITGSVPCRTQYMSAWAAAIDQLTWNNDILFIVAAGNLPLNHKIGFTRLSVKDHLLANRLYPNYLLENSCRVANPAQSFQALTVSSIALASANIAPCFSIAQKDKPSAFSCSGLGIWETIKPEVVEYGGDFAQDGGFPPNITYPKDLCPELVRSTLNGGPAIASDAVGTSFAAPKVSHIAACLAAELPDESCLLYRALIVQSARWPEWTIADNLDKLQVIRQIGYGIPNLDRVLGNAPNRITLITRGEQSIKAKQAHIYQVKLPEKLRSQGEELDILLEVTLSYKAQPRRTRRNRRKYLSTWLDWDCSKRGEDPERFLARTLANYDAPEDSDKGESLFKWMLGKQKNHGTIRDVSRSAGTIQKDWTVVKSFELTEAFCIAVVGHEGWNNEPEATVPYSLVVSFEAVEANIPIYAALFQAQIELEVEQEVEIQALGGG